MPNTSEETLKVVFERASGHLNSVERVKRIKDFAFVHFYEREHALKALQMMNGRGLAKYSKRTEEREDGVSVK